MIDNMPMTLPLIIQDLYESERDLPLGPEFERTQRDEPRTKPETPPYALRGR